MKDLDKCHWFQSRFNNSKCGQKGVVGKKEESHKVANEVQRTAHSLGR